MDLPVSIDRRSSEPLQRQLRRALISAIHDSHLQPGQKILSSRALSDKLGIARNTVTAVYEELIARGYLESRPRRGCFVTARGHKIDHQAGLDSVVDWQARLRRHPSRLNHIRKPQNWHEYPYPFIFGQVDRQIFPLNAWREASRDMLGRAALDWWSADRAVDDDPLLVEQIRTRILPERGIYARPEEILITLGGQGAFFLLAQLLTGAGSRIGCEMPGYPDSRFIFEAAGGETVPLPVDTEGAKITDAAQIDLAILTPGSQCPTMTVMSDARRDEILALAQKRDFVIVEDDHDGMVSFSGTPSLKSRDKDGRVIYLGTLSKVLAPGVRLGYMVAPEPMISEARWMRRLIHRSVPLNNQRTAAIFLAEGHFLPLVRKLRAVHGERWYTAMEHLPKYMPGFKTPDPCYGGSSIWLECPEGVDAAALDAAARQKGVVFESGDPFVSDDQAGRFIRLGLSVIPAQAIAPGLKILGKIANSVHE